MMPIRLAYFCSPYLSNYRIMFVEELGTMDYGRSEEDDMSESVEHYRDAVKTIKSPFSIFLG